MDRVLFIAALNEELERVRTAIMDLRTMTGPVEPDDAIGRISRMDAINNQAITDSALRNAERKLEELERISNHLDDPGYGSCRKCGKPIQIQRLLIMPHSVHCVACAQ